MNATKYYVSTCRLVVQTPSENTWQELCRILPMLRNSLSCTVCEKLLVEPYTPEETSCEHHVCKSCRGGTKTLRPTCSWCKDYSKYFENVQLRILIQSYKKLCAYVKITKMYQHLSKGKENGQEMRDIIRESEGDMAPFSPLQEEEEEQQPERPSTPSRRIKVERLEDSEDRCSLRPSAAASERVQGSGSSAEPPDEIISSPCSKQSAASPRGIMRLEDRLKVCRSSLEEAPVVLVGTASADLAKEEEEEEEEMIIKSEFLPLTPSNTPQYSISRSETPSPPNAQRYYHNSTGGISRLSPVVMASPAKRLSESNERSATVLVQSLEAGAKDGEEGRPSGTSWIALSGFPSTTTRLTHHGMSASVGAPTSRRPPPPPTVGSLLKSSSSQPQPAPTSSLPQDRGKGKKKLSGCRCGNATQFPGKLTCCGQRCPCYVDRLSCLDCRCRGCNNPNLPGGGKLLPFADRAAAAAASVASNRLQQPPPTTNITADTDIIMELTEDGSLQPSQLKAASSPCPPYRTGNTSTLHQILVSTSQSSLASSYSKVRVVPSSSSYSSFAKVPASTLTTLTVPLSSLTNSGFKIQPSSQLQRREIKARVIPTTYRLEAMPYARAAIINKRPSFAGGGSLRLKPVSLVSVLGNTGDQGSSVEVVQRVKRELEDQHINV